MMPHEEPARPRALSELRVLKIVVVDWALDPNNHAGSREAIRDLAAQTARTDRVAYAPRSKGYATLTLTDRMEVVPSGSRGKWAFPADALRLGSALHRRRHYHLIEGADPMASGWVAWRLHRRFGLPFILHYHTDYFSSDAWRRESLRYRLLDAPLAAFLLPRANSVHAVSRAAARDAVRMGARPETLRIVRPIVHDAWFGVEGAPADRYARRRILFVGRMAPEKNVPVLLEAVRRLRAADVALHLDLAGSGELQPRFEALARRLGVEQDVTFLGQQTLAEIGALCRAATVLALPSSREALGKVIVEAGLCGLPAVASRIGGIPEVVEDGVTGLLVAPGDAAALAAALRRLIESPCLAERLGQAARERFGREYRYEPLIEAAMRAVWESYSKATG